MLTKEDIQAIRKADAVSFHSSDKESKIMATIEKRNPLFPANPLMSHRDITIGSNLPQLHYVTAFYYIGSALYSPEWQTITRLLRPGDRLELFWYPNGGTNQILKSLSLLGDFVRLIVFRGKNVLTFRLGESVGYDNTARMVH